MAAPAQVLEKVVHQRVELRLKDNRIVVGRLLGVDEHLNLVLEEAEERSAERTRHLGRIVLRGSSVITMNAPTTGAAPSGA
ncbi:MAG TPA: LSM domain-containing protein [Thermoplasmata archaeon]|nr:LSM domain-containing protein [Thermoplasmata archaeon]